MSRFVSSLLTKLLSFFCAALIPLASLAWAQEEVELQLREIRSAIEQTSLDVQMRRKTEADLAAAIEKARFQSESARTRASKLEKDYAELQQQRVQVDRQLLALQARQRELEGLARRRLTLLYVRRNVQGVQQLLAGMQTNDPFRHALYSARIRESDLSAFRELKAVATQLEQQRSRVNQLARVQEQTKLNLDREQVELKQKIAEHQALAQRAAKEKRDLEAALLRLQAQALRIETVLSSLMSGEKSQKPSAEDQKRERGVVPRFDGDGLQDKAQLLESPITGVLVTAFGSKIDGSGTGKTVTKGIEVAVAEGASIRSVADGKVVFVGSLPTVGSVVIIDHGKRSYSLYGRMVDSKLARGDTVDEGEVLGASTKPDSQGRNFYFEIRIAGNPVNPQKYLKTPYPKRTIS